MSRRRELPVPLRDAPFSVHEALAAGASRGRLDASDLAAPFHGGRSMPGVPGARSLVPLLGAGQAVTGPTAAALWELPLPLRVGRDPRIHVSSLAPTVAMRRPGVVGSQRTSGRVILVGDIPSLEPARVWVSLAGTLAEWDLVAVADRLISGTAKADALCTRADLERELRRAAGLRGTAALRQALEQAREGAWSRPETFVRLLIAHAGLPEPELNAAQIIDSGRRVYPDLSWPEYRVAVEYDGRWHDVGGQPADDAERHERFVDAGWSIVHVRSRDVFDRPSALVARLIRRMRAAGAPTSDVEFARMPRFGR